MYVCFDCAGIIQAAFRNEAEAVIYCSCRLGFHYRRNIGQLHFRLAA